MKKIDIIKKQLAPWFLARGFVSNTKKRIWIRDDGFYLTFFEIQPYYGDGFFLNIGIKFLWSNYFDVSYDFNIGDSRIDVQSEPMTELIFFESPKLTQEIVMLLQNADLRAQTYSNLKQLDFLLESLRNRKDFVAVANKGHSERDLDRAIAEVFAGNIAKAKCLLQNNDSFYPNPIAKKLLETCEDKKAFQAELLQIINTCREGVAQKLKIQLSPIDVVFS